MTRAPGRGWAYFGAILGGAVSIAANVAHSYVAAGDPAPLAVAMSVFWPVALFVAVEILARVQWPAGGRWAALRFGGLLPVAFVAALVSYRHLSGLLAHYGEDPVTVALGPLAVDGLMLMATGALIATGRRVEPVAELVEVTPAPAPADPAPVTPPPAEAAAKPRTSRPRPRSLTSAQKVAKAAAKLPAGTLAQIAAKAGVSESTARRHLPSATEAVAAETRINGTPVEVSA
ncbi:hypothetical protein GCM10010169_23520 [Micromonospora fulviviridis]|uniref:hypothetical protein n=1 Tax=Micromonospora fulviviridis TaxID=47860 RepID=UPI00198A056F|nr:hypothetical protein [Micromonospora fulviviridis]GGR78634.1 hypothetical protein GCM10010169_23520 [Micromonospora fulviviridis]